MGKEHFLYLPLFFTNMRRFSSEGSLLDLDFLPWKGVALKNPGYEKNRESGTYTLHVEDSEMNKKSFTGLLPTIQEPGVCVGEGSKKELTKEHSVSVENMRELGKPDRSHLGVCVISEGCRAYSDSQLAPATQESPESVGGQGLPHPSSPSFNPFSSHSQLTPHHKTKLSAAKLHLKTLFGQSLHSSNSNLLNTEQKDGASERPSHLLFMRQWSQVGLSKKRKFCKEELEKWAKCLNTLLASQAGVSVFGAFLRSEFSEENLQFYLACEQYRHSSNNFSLHRRAKEICATYIQPGSPREVNLDSKTRDLTIQLLQAPSHTSLSHAQKRIYSILDTDCFPRFLQSHIYLSLLQEAD